MRIEHGPGGARPRRTIASALCRSTCCSAFRTISRPPSAPRSPTCGYLPSVKVAFESPRFWEAEGIYGGLGWTDQANENLLYPSGGWHSDKGVLVAAYTAGWTGPNHPQQFTAASHEERFRVCRDVVERMHPGQARELAKGVTVAWGLTPWSEGVGPIHPDFGPAARPARYAELLRPEGPIVFAGEHLSYIVFWQEGAALSAHEAMRVLTETGGGAARGRLSDGRSRRAFGRVWIASLRSQ